METSWTPEPENPLDTPVKPDVWADDPDRTTRNGDTRSAEQVTDDILIEVLWYQSGIRKRPTD